jgi:hypothetical protein
MKINDGYKMNDEKVRVADVICLMFAHENMGLNNDSGLPVPPPEVLREMADAMIKDLGQINPKLAETAPEEVAEECKKIWQDNSDANK